MNNPESTPNALALPTAPLFASSWLALFMALRAQLGDGQRPDNPRRAGADGGRPAS